MIKILLDTDIGGDVDDAVCLAYLLAHSECDLLGITTVTGEADKRAALASVLCKVAGKEVPIYPGLEVPMAGEQRQTVAEQAAALPRWAHETEFPQGQAIDFMRQTIRAHPGEVILLTIGPLTNAGQLFVADPGIAHLLKGLVLMGGIFTDLYPDKDRIDWNLIVDPLAAATIFDPTLCEYRQGTVTIDRMDQSRPTHFTPGDELAPHQVAVSVDVGRYFDHFFNVFHI